MDAQNVIITYVIFYLMFFDNLGVLFWKSVMLCIYFLNLNRFDWFLDNRMYNLTCIKTKSFKSIKCIKIYFFENKYNQKRQLMNRPLLIIEKDYTTRSRSKIIMNFGLNCKRVVCNLRFKSYSYFKSTIYFTINNTVDIFCFNFHLSV